MRLIVKPDLNTTILYCIFLYYSYNFYKFAKKTIKDKNLIHKFLLPKLKKIYSTLKKPFTKKNKKR